MTDTRSGKCLCGAVTFEADLVAKHFEVCHCGNCRKWGGAPVMSAHASAVRIAEGSPASFFASSDYGERGFCATCGTHLMWRMKDHSMIAVWLGALDNADDLTFETQIFIDSKPEQYSFANETKVMTGAEVFAAATGDDA